MLAVALLLCYQAYIIVREMNLIGDFIMITLLRQLSSHFGDFRYYNYCEILWLCCN